MGDRCFIEVGDTFVWQDDHKSAREDDTVLVRTIRIDEDGTPWIDILNYRDEPEKIAASDIHEKVDEGLLAKV